MGNWVRKTLGELTSYMTKGIAPKYVEAEGVGTIRVLNQKCNRNYEISYVDSRIHDLTAKDVSSEKMISAGDVLINSTGVGTAGRVAQIWDIPTPTTIDGHMILLRPTAEILPLYYGYAIKSFQKQIEELAEGSTGQTEINRNRLRNEIVISFPVDQDEQQMIGRLLANIDGKIKNNEMINNNLEQQALALFRHYFMNYEPYGGSAPSSWTAVSLDDVCVRITDGSHYSPADDPDAPYPMYSVKDMETYGFNSSSCKHITEEEFHRMQKNDCVPRLNDILVAKDGSYLKEIFICSEERNEAILSSIAIFRPDTEIIMPEILLYLLKQPSVRKDVGDNYVSGSALPRIVLKDFKKYSFLLPPMTEQSKIGSVLHSIRMQTKANIDEVQRLSALRDALLPRLMSGELDVSNLDL